MCLMKETTHADTMYKTKIANVKMDVIKISHDGVPPSNPLLPIVQHGNNLE